MEPFRERLLELINENNMTQTSFAETAGLTRQAIGLYVNENRSPGSESLKNICIAFDVSADWMLGLSEVKMIEPEKAAACKYTGLSEEAIEAVRNMKKSKALESLLMDLEKMVGGRKKNEL